MCSITRLTANRADIYRHDGWKIIAYNLSNISCILFLSNV